jgi:hypothetical protein
MLTIFAETMKQTLLPIFTMLVEHHNIIPIWLDIPPAGKMNLTTGENIEVNLTAEVRGGENFAAESVDPNFFSGYYKVLPRLNDIGRQMMVDAGGLVLPIWDVSFPRWNDHRFGDNPYAYDQLHWCAQRQLSVPAVWVQLLAQVLYGNDDETSQRISINNINNGTEAAQPLLRSLQGGAAVQQQDVNNEQHQSSTATTNIRHRRLLAAEQENRPKLVSPSIDGAPVHHRFSSSNQSPCECATAKVMNRCRANLRCSWNNETEACSERASA